MATAIMTSALSTGHKTHPYPPLFSAHITVFLSFRFWHLFSPSTCISQNVSKIGVKLPSIGPMMGYFVSDRGLGHQKAHGEKVEAGVFLEMTREAGADREQEGEPTTCVQVLANVADPYYWGERESSWRTELRAILLGQKTFQDVIAKLPPFWVSLYLEWGSWRV